jgi:hypothetical protein
MLTFNTVLQTELINPADVRLVRHQDTRHRRGLTPYDLWRANDGRFEFYQRIQGTSSTFDKGDLLASFVATPRKETLFVGLYRVEGIGSTPKGTLDPLNGKDVGGLFFYDINPDPRLAHYRGLLVINWGDGYRKWIQRAIRRDKLVLEIRKEIGDPPFPGFTEFRWDIDELVSVPPSWQALLKCVKGVYLLVCKKTGASYVGSAKGEESFWGRFSDYAKNGHGGNVELKARGKAPYQVTVLEVVNFDHDIARIEEAWKQKLLSRKFGLNKN